MAKRPDVFPSYPCVTSIHHGIIILHLRLIAFFGGVIDIDWHKILVAGDRLLTFDMVVHVHYQESRRPTSIALSGSSLFVINTCHFLLAAKKYHFIANCTGVHHCKVVA